MEWGDLKVSLLQGVIVLVPTYSVAWFTDKMVWTIPMLAAMGFVAASIKKQPLHRKVDEAEYKEGATHDIEDG